MSFLTVLKSFQELDGRKMATRMNTTSARLIDDVHLKLIEAVMMKKKNISVSIYKKTHTTIIDDLMDSLIADKIVPVFIEETDEDFIFALILDPSAGLAVLQPSSKKEEDMIKGLELGEVTASVNFLGKTLNLYNDYKGDMNHLRKVLPVQYYWHGTHKAD